MNILCLGEALIDFKGEGDLRFQGYVGGSPLNVAVAASRLGGAVGFASQVSNDMFGESIVAHLKANGVDTTLLRRSDAPTTLAFVTERGGDAHYSFVGHGAADRLYDPQPRPVLGRGVGYAMFGSISLLGEPAASAILDVIAAHQGQLVGLLDPNVRPALIPDRKAFLGRLERWLSLARVVKVSRQDLEWLWPGREPEDSARGWLRHGPDAVVLTRGGGGAVMLRLGREPVEVEAPEIEVVDTVGAGDTFTGALMVALAEREVRDLNALDDDQARATLRFAAAAAALNCTRAGADPPKRDALDAFLGRADE